MGSACPSSPTAGEMLAPEDGPRRAALCRELDFYSISVSTPKLPALRSGPAWRFTGGNACIPDGARFDWRICTIGRGAAKKVVVVGGSTFSPAPFLGFWAALELSMASLGGDSLGGVPHFSHSHSALPGGALRSKENFGKSVSSGLGQVRYKKVKDIFFIIFWLDGQCFEDSTCCFLGQRGRCHWQ